MTPGSSRSSELRTPVKSSPSGRVSAVPPAPTSTPRRRLPPLPLPLPPPVPPQLVQAAQAQAQAQAVQVQPSVVPRPQCTPVNHGPDRFLWPSSYSSSAARSSGAVACLRRLVVSPTTWHRSAGVTVDVGDGSRLPSVRTGAEG